MDEQQKRLAEELLFSDNKKIGFGKALYFGAFDSAQILPYPILQGKEKSDAAAFLTKVKDYIEKEIDPDSIDRQAEIPEEVLDGLSQIGVLGMTVPQEHGGLGMSQYAYCQVVEAIAGRCASTALLINAHQSIGLKALLLFGTEKQRKRWLKPLAQGEAIGAFSLTEPNAGSDAAGIETKAVYDPIKKIYLLNGKKQWTTSGSLAKVLTVMAKTNVDTPQGPQEKVTAFLVTPDMPGFKVTAAGLEKVGMRGTRTSNLEFTDMEVPAENVLGPLGGGLKVCLTVLDYGRTTFGAMCTGAAKFLQKHAVQHAVNRYQFKRPLASFGLVRKKLATMAALTYAMEAGTYLLAGLIDHGVEDIMLESAMLKVFASSALWTILYDTMQIYGGRSFFTDHPFERMMRDARLNMIGEGSNEVLLAFIGAVGMRDVGVQLKAYMDALKHPIKNAAILKKAYKQLIKQMRSPKVNVHAKELQPAATRLGKDIRRFGWSIIRLLAQYRENIVEQQLELERIAESAIALFTSTAVLGRLDAASKAGISKAELDTGLLYCDMAHTCCNKQMDALFSTQDKNIDLVAWQLTGIKAP